jgi:hypothetical protein
LAMSLARARLAIAEPATLSIIFAAAAALTGVLNLRGGGRGCLSAGGEGARGAAAGGAEATATGALAGDGRGAAPSFPSLGWLLNAVVT